LAHFSSLKAAVVAVAVTPFKIKFWEKTVVLEVVARRAMRAERVFQGKDMTVVTAGLLMVVEVVVQVRLVELLLALTEELVLRQVSQELP